MKKDFFKNLLLLFYHIILLFGTILILIQVMKDFF